MAHDITIIINGITELNGGAETGSLAELSTAAQAVDTAIPNLTPKKQEKAHELLEGLQNWLTAQGTYSGAGEQVDWFTDELNLILA